MFCPVTVLPSARRNLRFLLSHCTSVQEARDILECYDVLTRLVQFDPAKLGTCMRP
jgi:hypothetical protein